MGEIIKRFEDGSYIEYDTGSFDKWCVYLNQPDGSRRPPKDMDYFSDLKRFAAKYGEMEIYNDFVSVYEITGKQVEPFALQKISDISSAYGGDSLEIDRIFSILYLAMIAEERKKGTRLGKRIKRLGIHVLLVENRSVSQSANFMRGMRWQDIDLLCKHRGF